MSKTRKEPPSFVNILADKAIKDVGCNLKKAEQQLVKLARARPDFAAELIRLGADAAVADAMRAPL